MNLKYKYIIFRLIKIFSSLKVGLRALGFDIHKAEAQKLMHDYDRQGKNKITYQDFHEVGKYIIDMIDTKYNHYLKQLLK
jgi:Ca2+-binding EF-hand superfamily protein